MNIGADMLCLDALHARSILTRGRPGGNLAIVLGRVLEDVVGR